MEAEVAPEMGMMEIDVDVAMDEYVVTREEIVVAFNMATTAKGLRRWAKHMRIRMANGAMVETFDAATRSTAVLLTAAVLLDATARLVMSVTIGGE
jgi:hypothetical protein